MILVEAPTLTKHLGKYVLFYSGNACNSGRYFVNYATAATLDGKFEKNPGALLSSNDIGVEFISPGGQSLLPAKDPGHLVFHAFTSPAQGSWLVAGLTWDAAGAPVVHLSRPNRSEAVDPRARGPTTADRMNYFGGILIAPSRRIVSPFM